MVLNGGQPEPQRFFLGAICGAKVIVLASFPVRPARLDGIGEPVNEQVKIPPCHLLSGSVPKMHASHLLADRVSTPALNLGQIGLKRVGNQAVATSCSNAGCSASRKRPYSRTNSWNSGRVRLSSGPSKQTR